MVDITKLFDSYNRTARLYPALLSVAPILWTLGVFHPEVVAGDTAEIIVSAIVVFGGLYLLASIARNQGKAIESGLNKSWGGLRSIAFLRHLDETIDSFTKSRYHKSLETLCGDGFTMPSPEEERLNPKEADAKYHSATRRLIEHRRDNKKYDLLHKELASYGFRRNLLGMRTIALLVALLATAINGAEIYHIFPEAIDSPNVLLASMKQEWLTYSLFLVNVINIAVWLFLINSDFVRRSSEEYAFALFRTLDGADTHA